ncbi:glycosyltransferase [Novipirellula artificiosorum]|uniref:Glycosyltransferase subfamily 4-like N-terminal domain-containing protein n=1 Tax=Novipirellula artificiosorum TaxID=2528016 RepID=A0A5C6D9Q8_9BACT|nr:glycosyltransferase [Novipirellula artificiosorum]TWU32905.1 hypothetical protein Poly41_52830 [Novipirellula artificiosorum]
MNPPLRVLLVGRHFWPSASYDSTGFLCQLATGLHRSGVHVEVLSPRYAATWPERFEYREIPVHRPAAAPRSDWSMGRYVRHVTSWLKEHGRSFDVILVDSIREESVAAVDAAKSVGVATILISGGWAEHGDPLWWQTTRAARRCGVAAKSADFIIAKDAATQRLLISSGIPTERVRRIEIGFANSTGTADDSREAARTRLGKLNSDLSTMPDTPVIACLGRMERDGPMGLLSQSARYLVTRNPDVRIWFIGDGPTRQSLYDFMRADGVRNSIAMPGSFVDPSDLLIAADLYVQGAETGLDFSLPAAVAAAIPIVAVETPTVRALLGQSQPGADPAAACNDGSEVENVTWFAKGKAKSLRGAIRSVMDHLPDARKRARMLRRDLVRTRPHSQAIADYVDLIHHLRQQQRRRGLSDRPGNPSFEAAS